MKIEINSNIDWTTIAIFAAGAIMICVLFIGSNKETQFKQQTKQMAIEKGWTIEQVEKLR